MPLLRTALLSLGCVSALATAGTPDPLLQSMSGTWTVRQRMWPGPEAKPVELPAAVAQRRLSGDAFLEEAMQPAEGGTAQTAFNRTALVNFNAVTRQYEYTSLDTRAPQLMVEKGARTEGSAPDADLRLAGSTFTAPEWGAARDVEFSYRLTLGPVSNGAQTVRLYLTPLTKLPKREFLAFEYVYTKKP